MGTSYYEVIYLIYLIFHCNQTYRNHLRHSFTINTRREPGVTRVNIKKNNFRVDALKIKVYHIHFKMI